MSAAVLRRIFTDGGQGTKSGVPWASTSSPRSVSIASLTARIHCEGHNNQLSELDEVGEAMMRHVQEAQLEHEARDTTCWFRQVDGFMFERWLLKVAFGFWQSGNFSHGGKQHAGAPPIRWKRLLLGLEQFGQRQGLHMFKATAAPFYLSDTELSVYSHTRAEHIHLVDVDLARVSFRIAISRFVDASKFERRPIALEFRQRATYKTVEFNWHGQGGANAIFYNRVGDAPQP